MLRREAIPLSALLLASPLFAQTQSQPDKSASSSPPAESQDLERMRSLLSQMQNNLASLPSGYSPTKHQFELEIDMWRLLLNQMERAHTRSDTRP
jgi:hypothetical protein